MSVPASDGATVDVVGVGNALVDVLSLATDEFLDEHGLTKGAMALIDADQAERLYAAMGPGTEMSGGSAANTMVRCGLARRNQRLRRSDP